MDQKEITSNLKDVNQWTRILYMVLFSICLYVAVAVLFLVATIQAIFAIVTAKSNANLRQLGSSLSQYIHQLSAFLTYSSEQKAFPLGDWPKAEEDPSQESAEKGAEVEVQGASQETVQE
jgi:Domain of unknown function (DUF4389)